jgi:hypothetical protein
MSYANYQQPGPSQPSSGAKTCLIFGLVGVVLLGLLGVAGVVGLVLLGRSVQQAAREEQEQWMSDNGISLPPRQTTPRPTPAVRVEDISEPKTVTEAIAYLNRSEFQYHEVAAKWLKTQPVNASQQATVSAKLVEKTRTGSSTSRAAAMDAFEKWAHGDSAGDFAEYLRPGQSDNARRLRILAQLKRLESAEKISKLLETAADAPEALVALKAIGEESVVYLLPLLESDKPYAVKAAKDFCEHFDIHVEHAQGQRFAAMLSDSDRGNNKEAIQGLIGMEVIPEIQPEISKQLGEAVSGAGFDIDDLLKAIQIWGDAQCVPALNAYLEKEAFLDNHPELFKAINVLDDDRSIDVLVAEMTEFAVPVNRISDCLANFGDRATPEVIKLINHENEQVRKGVQRFMGKVQVSDDLVMDQCLLDLKNGKDKVASSAFETLDQFDLEGALITDARRNEVAAAMGDAVDNVFFTDKEKAGAICCKWATEKQLPMLVEFMGDREEHKWKPALERVVLMNRPEQTAVAVAEMLTNFFKKEKTAEILRDAGPVVEDLAIALVVGLDDADALYVSCDLLARYGTEKCLMPLNDLTKRASRAGGNDGKKIVLASKQAIQIIKERLAAERKSADDTTR